MKPLHCLILSLSFAVAAPLKAQSLVEWTEGPGRLGLGYPVPIPQDSVLPFDGFRTYASLHTRHQDLMLSTPWVSGQVVGETHAGRDIWAYRVGDDDLLTVEGLPEPAVMIQGGIHAREWQSPEVVTGVMELLVEQADDNHLYSYLRDNVNTVVLPVHNIDGFLQTQRFPTQSWLDSDPQFAASPRDGRMRRKNMLGVDEDIFSVTDHLLGVDLNRNNPPYWATTTSSSPDVRSLVHHGSGPHGEPETQAMATTAVLGPEDRLRLYTDVHSFSQLFFSVYTTNARRNAIQDELLRDFQNFQFEFPSRKFYPDARDGNPTGGIGSTDDFFGETYDIPSFTLEIEPSGQGGADYGGLATNGNDGFILPAAEIRRVREELAQSFAVAYYGQAGAPHVRRLQIVDLISGAVVVDREWDSVDTETRNLHQADLQTLQPERDYQLLITFSKPMRYRNDSGDVAALPGQPVADLAVDVTTRNQTEVVDLQLGDPLWLEMPPTAAAAGYDRYRDDTVAMNLRLATVDAADAQFELEIDTTDMVGQRLDANPASILDWSDGAWSNYENSAGVALDAGGVDSTLSLPVAASEIGEPFVIEPGTSAAWFDANRNGEGFLVEVIAPDRAIVFWFTYDTQGQPRWFIGDGVINANRISIAEFREPVQGSVFGPNFVPGDVQLESAGSAELLFEGCDAGYAAFSAPNKRKLRHQLTRLSSLDGLNCGEVSVPSTTTPASGSWYDPEKSGRGFVVQQLSAERVIVYWFTFDDQAEPLWLLGDGVLTGNTLTIDEVFSFTGPQFGQDFDPSSLQRAPWGTLSMTFGCDSATATFNAIDERFGNGTINLSRLTFLSGFDCAQ